MSMRFLFIVFLALCLVGCEYDPNEITYFQPVDMHDGLLTGTVDAVGINWDRLAKGIDSIKMGRWGEVHSILIYIDGRLVIEEYFPGHHFSWEHEKYQGEWSEWGPAWGENEWHVNMSVTKSYTAALVGIAIEQGFVNNKNEPIFEYLPDYQYLAQGGKENITIEHLLTMTSGLEWDEWHSSHSDLTNDATKVFYCEDQIECILEKELVHEPGMTFNYNGGNHIILGEIIQNSSGMALDEFLEVYLYQPLEIAHFPYWDRFESGVFVADGGLVQTSREMLKFGITFLNGGKWKDEQIIPLKWVKMSAIPYRNNSGIRVPGSDGGPKGYGYSWWTWKTRHNGQEIDVYYAGGWGGQRIFIIPDLDSVIVMTGGNYTRKTHTFRILEKYLLPAME